MKRFSQFISEGPFLSIGFGLLTGDSISLGIDIARRVIRHTALHLHRRDTFFLVFGGVMTALGLINIARHRNSTPSAPAPGGQG